MKIAIYGAGGFGREVVPLAHKMADSLVFVSDLAAEIGKTLNGLRVIPYGQLLKEKDRKVVVAIADIKARRRIAAQCEKDGLLPCSVIAVTHRSQDDVQIGEGAVICDNTMIGSNVRIGKHFHCNWFSYVGHDCRIGDFVTFAPRVSCNGRIVIEDDVFIGTGAILRPGTPGKPLIIGKGAHIGMGAVVTKDVKPGGVVHAPQAAAWEPEE